MLDIDRHSNIPPGAVPPFNGTYLHAWEQRMAGAAAADRFVVYLNEWYMGADSSRPLAKMRDYVEILRAVVAAKAGEAVRYEGPVHRINWRELEAASGRHTCAERLGHKEFVPWRIGPVM